MSIIGNFLNLFEMTEERRFGDIGRVSQVLGVQRARECPHGALSGDGSLFIHRNHRTDRALIEYKVRWSRCD